MSRQHVREITDVDRLNVAVEQPLTSVFHCRVPTMITLP